LDQASLCRLPDQITRVVRHRDDRYDCRGVRSFSGHRESLLTTMGTRSTKGTSFKNKQKRINFPVSFCLFFFLVPFVLLVPLVAKPSRGYNFTTIL
jgi:hypothetical protein